MTNLEFSQEFDILYDSISSMNAPGLDAYEKSVFLTQAQLQIIKEYNGIGNKYKTGFEGSDKRRSDLRELIKEFVGIPKKMTSGVSDLSYQIDLPEDVFLIKYEAAYYQKRGCPVENKVDIIPKKYDEYHEDKRNPFRRPDKENGFRLDISSDNGTKRVELVVDREVNRYQVRYIKYPKPIVLEDLGGVSSEALSIDGIREKTECELDDQLHREILDRAVELALAAYKPSLVDIKARLDSRNN